MRLTWTALGSLVALTALAATGLAHAPSIEDPIAGTETESPAVACVPTCEVDSTRQAYRPGVLVVSEGAEVTWMSADGDQHTSTANPITDTPTIVAEGSSGFYPDACFDVDYQPSSPGAITFDVREDGLYALETSAHDAAWQPCEEAVEAGAGYLVAYHCKKHPQLQHGSLLVLPAGDLSP